MPLCIIETGNDMKPEKSKGTVWDDIAADPAEAALLKIKAALLDSIIDYIDGHRITHIEAAKRLGVQRSQIDDLSSGMISGFTVDHLILMVERVGINPLKIVR